MQQSANQPIEGMTEEQARQLLEAVAGDTDNLQVYLNQAYVVPNSNVPQ